ncbi:TBC1 domain, member 5 [Perkinsus chesapeaki]|uniref:TBC1 domain, member 5 n=1 Tax=Perkinsus chesapeaki TaxID=330153 RepID=A0A7J6LMB0_PERCH|nr:TBC1 domain, member 5 [Perkinsus chesapeaki]
MLASNDSPLASVGIDDDMYDREVGVDIKDAALAVIKGEKNIKRLRAYYWPHFIRTVVDGSDYEANRRHYRSLLSKHQPKSGGLLTKQFKGMDPNVCNPLSKASENPWNQEHKKTDIMNEIWLDVSRTNYSNREWFGKEENQRRMQRILYVWCKERNKEYRQGMSDIATVLLYGIIGDESGNNITSDGAADGEADAYILFDAIMSGHISHSDMFYSDAAPGYHNNISPLAPSAAAPPKSRILERCEHIFNVLLPKADRDLSDHLHNSAKVAPSLFLMRWVRLLFAREMHVVEVLRLWDMLFADSYLHWVSTNEVALPLVDFMAVSMILQVKSTLMVGDNTACLQRLMRYPPVEHVEPLVGVALRLRDGDKALRPRIVSDNVDDARVAEDESIVEEQSASPVSEHLDQQQTSEPRYSQATTQQTNSSMRQLPIDPLRAEHPGSLSALFGSVVHSAVDAFSTALAEGRPTPQSYDGKPQGVSNTRLEGQGTASPIRMPGDLTDSWEEGDFGDNSPQKDEDSHRPCEVTDTELERWQRALDDTIAVISGAALSSDTTLADSAIDRLRDISASIGEARRRRQDLPPTVD